MEDNSFMQPTPPEHITMDYDEWFETYKPLENPLNNHASLDGTMFETYGDELDAVKADPAHVWTFVTDDHGENIAISGGQYVNRLGYIITEVLPPISDIYDRVGRYMGLATSYLSNFLVGGEDDDTRWFILQCQERGALAAAAIHCCTRI